jgi:hypothetical protein
MERSLRSGYNGGGEDYGCDARSVSIATAGELNNGG